MKQQHKRRSTLLGVTMLASFFLILSDFVVSSNQKMFCLSIAYGIINAGTSDGSVGAGVTYAMTGHLTKVGTGFGGDVLLFNNHHKKKKKETTPTTTPAHRTSVNGLIS